MRYRACVLALCSFGLVVTPTFSQTAGVGSPTRRGQLAEGQSALIPFNLVAGRSYTFSGRCDSACSDLDLMLLRNGEDVDHDSSEDATAVVSETPEKTAAYSLEVKMVACSASRCGYTIQIAAR